MTFPQGFPLLSAIVWTPLVGALLAWTLGARRPRLGRALALGASLLSLILGARLLWAFEPEGPAFQLVELRSWVPSLGLSYELGVDALGAWLVVWTTLLSAVAVVLAVARRGREVALLLVAEASLLGMAAARDGLLFLCFYGATLIAVFGLAGRAGAGRKVLGHQLTGFLFFAGAAFAFYRLALEQTGFPTAELSRWADLVVYPRGESGWLLLAAAGAAVAAPLAPFGGWVEPTIEALTSAGRVLFLGGVIWTPALALTRLVLPLAGGGAERWAGALALFALLSMGYAIVARYRGPRSRSFVPLLVGLQAIVLAALASSPGDAGGIFPLAFVLGVVATWTAEEPRDGETTSGEVWPSVLFALVLLVLVARPLASFFLSPVFHLSTGAGAAAVAALTLMGLRLLHASLAWRPRASGVLLALCLLLGWAVLSFMATTSRAVGPELPASGVAERSH